MAEVSRQAVWNNPQPAQPASSEGGAALQLTPLSPGERLRTARERREKSREDLAHALNVPVRYVEAIDRDDYQQLPGAIFARGYLRTYAREVGESGDEIVGLFDALLAAEAQPAELEARAEAMGNARGGWREPILWWLGLGLIAVLLLLSATLWWPEDETKAPASQLSRDKVEVLAGDGSVVVADLSRLGELGGELKAPAVNALLSGGLAEPGSPVALAGDIADEPLTKGAAGPASEAGAERGAAAAPGGQTGGPAELAFTLAAQSWIKVTDAGGDILFASVAEKGERLTFQGEPPFQLVFGRADAVERFAYNGRAVALDEATEGGVARFSWPRDGASL